MTKHFPNITGLIKYAIKNNIKINYSCMPNMSAVILRHNKKLLFTLPKADRPFIADSKCNCKIKTVCPLNGECKQKSIAYKAEIFFNNTNKLYYGFCSSYFKTRFSNHKHSFTHRNKKKYNRAIKRSLASKGQWRLAVNKMVHCVCSTIISLRREQMQPVPV